MPLSKSRMRRVCCNVHNVHGSTFTTTKPFNAVELQLGDLASVLGTLNVYGSCVSLQ